MYLLYIFKLNSSRIWPHFVALTLVQVIIIPLLDCCRSLLTIAPNFSPSVLWSFQHFSSVILLNLCQIISFLCSECRWLPLWLWVNMAKAADLGLVSLRLHLPLSLPRGLLPQCSRSRQSSLLPWGLPLCCIISLLSSPLHAHTAPCTPFIQAPPWRRLPACRAACLPLLPSSSPQSCSSYILFSSFLFCLSPPECKPLWGKDYHLLSVWANITLSLMVPDP